MLETLLKMYVMSMAHDIRSPMPHMIGPPGSAKSTYADMLAELVGKDLHIINVSRISPLELEGVQMPVDDNTMLRLLPATFWTQLKEGDILLMDEFLRGFPEVYNGLLDIFTSRRVGAFRLPKVFIIGASNTSVAYDQALEDRLLHIKVPDPRGSSMKAKAAKRKLAEVLIKELGLLEDMVNSMEMQTLLDQEVLPMYEVLDHFGKGAKVGTMSTTGHSLRHLIGMAQLRHVEIPALRELLDSNNRAAIRAGKYQFVVLASGKGVDPKYVTNARKIQGNPRLTPVQARNLDLNLQLIGMEDARKEEEIVDEFAELA